MATRNWLKTAKPVIPKDELWTMKDGTKIPVGQMDEQHVRNALRTVIRWAKATNHGLFPKAGCDPFDGMPPPGCDEYGSLD